MGLAEISPRSVDDGGVWSAGLARALQTLSGKGQVVNI